MTKSFFFGLLTVVVAVPLSAAEWLRLWLLPFTYLFVAASILGALAAKYLWWPERRFEARALAPQFSRAGRRWPSVRPAEWLASKSRFAFEGIWALVAYVACAQLSLLTLSSGTTGAFAGALILYAWSLLIARTLEVGPARLLFIGAALIIPLPLLVA